MVSEALIGVMIVDDEAIIRKGLKATIPWEKYGMKVVADAPTGTKAWDAFMVERPEVVITDIVMPEMNGIELAKLIKENEPQTKVLLLSCHSDFGYVQQGIKLGASGYLLKTSYNDDELEEFLEQFQHEIDTHKRLRKKEGQKQFLDWLYGIDLHLTETLPSAKEWQWVLEPSLIYLAANATGEAALSLKVIADQWMFEVIKFAEDRFFLLGPAASCKEFDKQLIDLKSRYPQLRWIKEGPVAGIERWMEAVKRVYRQTETEHTYNVNPEAWPEPIALAVKMIVQRVDEKLSVSDVAREVGLSRSHLSSLFKKTLGEGFVAYTYRTKLKAAQQLLTTTDTTVQDIADKLGMIDAKYFSKWFKRCTGKTPSEFRHVNKH
ncbi:response regulator [Paenibacillus sp. SYP-B3998]|uniref:Response regulator n=1 Tax=Paenibacillus sp. SYP-B3998 TaxID=2678564 RepID=A0A6G3ZTP7_9BACL|nr:response regulator [Paenibacillus sp. SYP-B3998]NEW04961.1 response regulator [Paenibacillus sp. SYP-B3998]